MKKFLEHFKDILVGLFFVAMTAGFVLMIAGAMYYFKPQDLIGEAAFLPRTRTAAEMDLGVRLGQLGLMLLFGSIILIKVFKKAESLIKARLKKRAKEREAAAEAAQENQA